MSTGFGVGFFPNRAVYIDTVVVSSNVPIYADLVISGQSSTLSLSANTSITVPINSIYRPFETVNSNFLIIKKLRNADGTDATAPTTNTLVTVGVYGRTIYDDMNLEAEKVILFLGDSVFCGSGRTTKLEMYDWKLRNFYADTQNVRGAMHATPGKTSTDYEVLRQNGVFDTYQSIALLVYELMINDAATKPGGEGGYVANYVSNLNKIITLKQIKFPNSKMLVLGCYPQQVVATEAAAVLLRAAAAASVIAANDPNILFCDLGQLGTAFSSVNANYASIDPVGGGIHPSALGDALIWNGNASFIGGLKGFLQTNLSKI